MKKAFKAIITLSIAAMMLLSSVAIVTAEEVTEPEDEIVITAAEDGDSDSSRAYQLVWKYKVENGHLYKRRWNATLGIWYDANWILVY